MKTKKNIADLQLHEKLIIENKLSVTRVPGGLIYTQCNHDGSFFSMVFVPFVGFARFKNFKTGENENE